MKSKRKKAVVKAMANHVLGSLNLINWNEHTKATCGISTISLKREIELLNTLEHYAEIIERTFGNEPLEKEWLIELSMHL